MAESRTSGGGSHSTPSVRPASANLSTHESDPGDGGTPSATSTDALKRGHTLGRYLVIEQVGAGAMGVVYGAYDPELDRKIAIKILRAHEGKSDRTRRQERLVREAKAMAKLSHPNVGAIYDVGVHGDQVFLAMEFLSGGTLRDWITAKKRPWREIVKMFIEVGKGLAGAHAEGLIHRDFKPDNVLIDKNGEPKVVDFGLVRLTGAAPDPSTTGSIDLTATEEVDAADTAAALPVAQTALAALTRTGALTGTPAYMAPEQFLGKPIDARTDQFAFCVALYEALYGERPFAGETVLSIAESVTEGRLRPPPTNAAVPAWVRSALIRGLKPSPADRYTDIRELLAVVSSDPQKRFRRRLAGIGALVVSALVVVLVKHTFDKRRLELEREVGIRVADADLALQLAEPLAARTSSLRRAAYSLFDQRDRVGGEKVWRDAVSTAETRDQAFDRAQQSLSAAVALDSGNEALRRRLAELLAGRAVTATAEFRSQDAGRHMAALREIDSTGQLTSRFQIPATVVVGVRARQFRARLEKFLTETSGSTTVSEEHSIPASARSETSLAPGAYRIRVDSEGYAPVLYPFVAHPGQHIEIVIDPPPAAEVPRDFIYIPPGTFLTGDGDEDLRQSFLNAAPIHTSSTDQFLISRYEVTFGQWIDFLNAIPTPERARHRPESVSVQGLVRLVPDAGRWRLQFKSSDQLIEASWDESLVYPGRPPGADRQQWRKLPVTGVSAADILAYLAWLSSTGRVPRARLCSEAEWERAARGADERVFPTGMRLRPAQANVDATYGRIPRALGADEVGRYPESRSPFGVDDMAGNVWEIVSSGFDDSEYVVRGGGFYHAITSARSTNRESIYRESRSPHIGFRVCADLQRLDAHR
jgi:serine/threonine protein kinase/formylglycine-generating enzyme required for sulfatase activity